MAHAKPLVKPGLSPARPKPAATRVRPHAGPPLVLALLLVVGALVASAAGSVGAPRPLYPDLRPEPARDLRFDTVDGSAVLRLTSSIRNVGRGSLEFEGSPAPSRAPKTVYQNLYAQPTGGRRVAREPVALDFLYHPDHNHFHVQDFASYQLFKLNGNGTYKPMSARGTKTGFCVADVERRSGTFGLRYESTPCNSRLQGLTPGWADVYGHWLTDQWVVLGDSYLPDGRYALRITADPKGRVLEGGRTKNNTSQACFRVADESISMEPCA